MDACGLRLTAVPNQARLHLLNGCANVAV